MSSAWRAAAIALALIAPACAPVRISAQISLPSAVNLALENSPRVKVAQADLDRAAAVLTQTKAAFIPAVDATGGVGKATGAPLSPPVVFSIAAQSLVFSFSQPDYIRAARSGVTSARLALGVARSEVAEDVTNTYITLDNALQRRAVESSALTVANHLVAIEQDRFNAGVDPHIELTKALRTQAQIRLQQLLIEDEIDAQAEHLASLTGLPATGLETVHSSIPELQPPTADNAAAEPDPRQDSGISAAFAAAQAKEYTALGDKRYLLRPQISFSANYSRISTAFTTYTLYYPGFGNPDLSLNSLGFGVQITLPILDMVHRAKARESAADAAHAFADAKLQQMQFLEGRHKLRHSAEELAARASLASLDHDLAEDQLEAVRIQLRASAATAQGQQLTPKDEANAELDERQRTLDLLNTELQLHQAEVNLMRQEGSLSNWLAATIPGATAAPAAASPETTPAVPPTIGAEPSTAAPTGTAPPSVPTTGTTPSSPPTAPGTTPRSSAPPPSSSIPSTPPSS